MSSLSGSGIRRVAAASGMVMIGVGFAAQAMGVPLDVPEDIADAGPPGSGVTSVTVAASGNIGKKLGEPAGLTLAGSGRAYFEFVVEGIEVVDRCPGRGLTVSPWNGHFVVIDLRARMSDAVTEVVEGGSELFMPLTADAFRLVGVDVRVTTETLTDASWACFGSDALAEPFVGPGEEASGVVVLDSPITSGTLVYAPSGRGWEWEFGE